MMRLVGVPSAEELLEPGVAAGKETVGSPLR